MDFLVGVITERHKNFEGNVLFPEQNFKKGGEVKIKTLLTFKIYWLQEKTALKKIEIWLIYNIV